MATTKIVKSFFHYNMIMPADFVSLAVFPNERLIVMYMYSVDSDVHVLYL